MVARGGETRKDLIPTIGTKQIARVRVREEQFEPVRSRMPSDVKPTPAHPSAG